MKKIAIVEDDGRIALSLSLVCQGLGHQPIIIELSGGPEELAAEIERHNPDAILLDHDLGRRFTGEDIYSELSQELQEKTIGISSSEQKYVPLHVEKLRLGSYGLKELLGGSK